MPNAFTHYWQNDTWERSAQAGPHRLAWLGGNSFKTRGVRPGDTVYAVTNLHGQMYLAGRLSVSRLLDRREAERILGSVFVSVTSRSCETPS